MQMKYITRRDFISRSFALGTGACFLSGQSLFSMENRSVIDQDSFPRLRAGIKELFVDDSMISSMEKVYRKIHPAKKLDCPVLEADMPWEQGTLYDGKRDRRIYIYGTVERDSDTGKFRMWYARRRNVYYAISDDGIHWERPALGQLGENNMLDLTEFQSPSIICDKWDKDPEKKYKAVGYGKGGYYLAFSADGISWHKCSGGPAFRGGDTITWAQDPQNGEYLAFHKVKDPNFTGRQVFLSKSKNMLDWTAAKPVMITDEIDHAEARKLERGTHSEFYNMSAFPYANQWLGLVTHFRRTGKPLIIKHEKGTAQSHSEGPIDVQLVHSRDGRTWHRCSDRSPVIPLGPYGYDAGSILGVCNSPVIVDDEMWMYYTAITTSHGGALPEKEMSIARAAWRLDGMVSLQADKQGIICTQPICPEGRKLYVNADVSKGKLQVEVIDANGNVMKGFSKRECKILKTNSVKHVVEWKKQDCLPENEPISLRFYLESGDLYSYMIDFS